MTLNRWRDSLYAIVDIEGAAGALAERALQSGCTALQLRDKHAADKELFAAAQGLRTRCRAAGVAFVVNDRPDLAAMVGADELHLGQEDMSIEDARLVVGAMRIGLSTHSLAQALEAERRGADRIAFGPVFATTSKDNPDPVVGLEQLREVCGAVSPPVVAIGGIGPENAASVLEAGATQFAVISALRRFVRD